jgi:hypothetical protein
VRGIQPFHHPGDPARLARRFRMRLETRNHDAAPRRPRRAFVFSAPGFWKRGGCGFRRIGERRGSQPIPNDRRKFIRFHHPRPRDHGRKTVHPRTSHHRREGRQPRRRQLFRQRDRRPVSSPDKSGRASSARLRSGATRRYLTRRSADMRSMRSAFRAKGNRLSSRSGWAISQAAPTLGRLEGMHRAAALTLDCRGAHAASRLEPQTLCRFRDRRSTPAAASTKQCPPPASRRCPPSRATASLAHTKLPPLPIIKAA